MVYTAWGHSLQFNVSSMQFFGMPWQTEQSGSLPNPSSGFLSSTLALRYPWRLFILDASLGVWSLMKKAIRPVVRVSLTSHGAQGQSAGWLS